MRLRHKPWAKEKLKQHTDIILQEPENFAGKWANSFQQGTRVHVEIGTGKGQFIVGMARQYPDILFIGIELMESVIVSALDRVLDEEITNVRLVHRHARELPALFAEDELDRIYLNFSDPWPKHRHEKRRLTYKTYLQMYEKLLKSDGDIHLKTDNQGLFDYSLESFQDYGMSVKNVCRDLHRSGMIHNVRTEYEEKFSQMGHPIYRCEARF